MSKAWQGIIRSIQLQVQMTRSFDQRDQVLRGYILEVEGQRGDKDEASFQIKITSSSQDQNQFRVGDKVLGEGALIQLQQRAPDSAKSPPWQVPAPPLSIYQERGYRRLSTKTYSSSCTSCIWGVCADVEMIIDQWKPSQREYRTETFCYGPLSCRLYKPGPKRKVPGRRGMTYIEEDWVDEQETSHRERHE